MVFTLEKRCNNTLMREKGKLLEIYFLVRDIRYDPGCLRYIKDTSDFLCLDLISEKISKEEMY